MTLLPIGEQVVSLELSKQLKELDVPQDGLFYYDGGTLVAKTTLGFTTFGCEGAGGEPNWYEADEAEELTFAFTVAELRKIMKQNDVYSGYSEEDVGWYCQSSIHNKFDITEEDNEAEARAKLLIYIIQNNLIDVRKI